MTYDPFQSNAALGAYAGAGNPFYSPLTAMQTSAINPSFNPSLVNQTASWNPLNGYQGIPQSNLPQWIAAGQMGYGQPTPWQGGWQHSVMHNPYVQQLAAQQLIQHIVAQQQHAAQQAAAQQLAALGQQSGGFYGQSYGQGYGQNGQIGVTGQQGSPFGQSPFGQIAPQSWVGQQTGQGGGPAQAVLLAQLTARALQAQGFNPGLTPGMNFPI